MVTKNFNKLVLILFISIALFGSIIFLCTDNKADNKFEELKFEGYVMDKITLDNKKGFFIKIDDNWFGVIDYRIDNYLEVGDFVRKDSLSRCIKISKNGIEVKKLKEFCDTYSFKVVNKNTIYRLNSSK